ncbi:MAG TPA: peptidase M23, partial [Clostridiaceae bacterium]|nr:peptidase M23 [Clostridiaceae bacterium]
VTISKNSGAYGKHVMISHSLKNQKYVTVYAHMNSLSVKSGQTVSKGMKIGTVGNTGNSFGNHLHFEIHKNSYKYSSYSAANSVNPLNYL